MDSLFGACAAPNRTEHSRPVSYMDAPVLMAPAASLPRELQGLHLSGQRSGSQAPADAPQPGGGADEGAPRTESGWKASSEASGQQEQHAVGTGKPCRSPFLGRQRCVQQLAP